MDIVDDAVKLVERLRGLAVEIDITGEVEAFRLVETLNDDGTGLSLTDESEDFSVAFLAEDHDLLPACLILRLDALLKLEYHRTGGIDDLDVVTTGKLIGLGGFAMGT